MPKAKGNKKAAKVPELEPGAEPDAETEEAAPKKASTAPGLFGIKLPAKL
jgi:hypothetical protein